MTPLFRLPSPLALATSQLEQAKRDLLVAEASREQAEAWVKTYSSRIARLAARVSELSKELKTSKETQP